MSYRIPLLFEPQPEGGFTVTSPLLPELITEGDTFEESRENVKDAFACLLEFYQDEGLSLPDPLSVLPLPEHPDLIWMDFETE